MKRNLEIKKIFNLMKNYSLRAGEILLKFRGKVTNIEKEGDNVIKGDAQSMAKTVVDEIVQEIFLAGLYKVNPKVRINVEEDTPLIYLFKENNGNLCTVHQDPCDGTKAYIDMKKDFATGYAISDKNNNFTHTVVYAPMYDRLYIASPEEFLIQDKKGEKYPIKRQKPSNIIYAKRIFSKEGEEKIKKAGFKIFKVSCSHLNIIDTALGKAGAFLYGGSNPHDSFIPYAFATKIGAKLFNIKGKKISTKDIKIEKKNGFIKFARLASVCYFSIDKEKRETIFNILSDKNNLHPDYLEKFAKFEK